MTDSFRTERVAFDRPLRCFIPPKRVRPLRVLFVLPGIYRINRGAEIAFLAVARALSRRGWDVTVFGGGPANRAEPFRYREIRCVDRKRFERWPSLPVFRSEFCYEEATFAIGLLRAYDPDEFDVTVTCSFPFVNWVLTRRGPRRRRPRHVFVTQNGDWPATSESSEFRSFTCDGLVCINPDYQERNAHRWNSALIPNGIDFDAFQNRTAPGPAIESLPDTQTRILMVSALSPYKRVAEAIDACSRVRGAHLVVAGNGPQRADLEAQAAKQMPGRFSIIQVPHEQMPALYQSCDVFLHLALEEPFGNVYLEALASGLPVVAHDCKRTRWIVGDREFLVDTSQPDAIASGIARAIREGQVGIRDRVDRASRFDWDEIAGRYAGFFDDISQPSTELEIAGAIR